MPKIVEGPLPVSPVIRTQCRQCKSWLEFTADEVYPKSTYDYLGEEYIDAFVNCPSCAKPVYVGKAKDYGFNCTAYVWLGAPGSRRPQS